MPVLERTGGLHVRYDPGTMTRGPGA